MVDSHVSTKYIYNLVNWGQVQPDLEISNVLINNKQCIQKRQTCGKYFSDNLSIKGLHRLITRSLSRIIYHFEAIKLRNTIYADHLKTYDLNTAVAKIITLNSIVSDCDLLRFDTQDINKIKALNLDLIINFGSGILRGEILKTCRLGFITLHYADNKINRRGPTGFWEVYYKQAQTGFVIRHITDELDTRNVLIRGAFPTQTFYLINQAQIHVRSYFYMKKLLTEIARNRSMPKAEMPCPYFNKLLQHPNIMVQLTYVARIIQNKLIFLVRYKLLKIRGRWGVAFSKTDWTELVMCRATKIENPHNHFLADPFVLTEAGHDYCFVEDFDYRKARGCISVYELKEEAAIRCGEAIIEPFHMSFPYLFRFGSKIYMVPETSQNNDIRLYECLKLPNEWKLKKVIMSDLSAADTMIFRHQGRWWLFTNIDHIGDGELSSELYIFYADDPVNDDWIPHLKNPVLIDPSKARNGGILFSKEDVYRVAQYQGFNQYGKGYTIRKIVCLNEGEYSEQEICKVEANFYKNLKGTHHLHSNGKISVFDYIEET